MFWFFGREACGILAPRPGIKPAPPALEGEVLTTGQPGKFLYLLYILLEMLDISVRVFWWKIRVGDEALRGSGTWILFKAVGLQVFTWRECVAREEQ